MPTAYSYKRFSSEKQAKGDSIRRQTELAAKYIADNPRLNLDLDTNLDLTDEGLSAFKGVHKTRGALGVFLLAVATGQIQPGSYLLVESLDRLSRQQPLDALTQLMELVKSGIVVVTVNDGKVYSTETMQGVDGTFVMMMGLVGMARAFEESDTKGKRVRAAWQSKFDKVKDGKQLTKRVPFWLTSDRKPIRERAEVVRRIFTEYAAGSGTSVITKRLNSDGVAPPSHHALHWSDSSVKKLLKSKTTIGILVTADGQEHEGYYPCVVSDELWFKCQLQISTGSKARDRTGEPKPLAGLLRCSCNRGGTIVRVARTGRVKMDGTRTLFESVACSKAKLGIPGCVYKSIPYRKVLRSIESHVTEIQHAAGATSNDEELMNIDGYIDSLLDEVRDAYELFRETKSATARDTYQRLDRELVKVQEERKQLAAAVGTVGSEVMEMLMKQPQMTNQWLRKVFKEGVLDLWSERLTLVLQNGKTLEVDLNERWDGANAL